MSDKIDFPLNVFISSVMRNDAYPERKRILDIRKGLSEELDKYKFIKKFLLEEDNSSSLPLEQEYLTYLHSCDVILFLIDADYPISEGVSIEIAEARVAEKTRIFYIIPSKDDQKNAAIKHKLISQNEKTYINIKDSSNFVEEIMDDFLSEIVTVYRSKFINFHYNNVSDDRDKNTFESIAMYQPQLSKKIFENLGLSTQYIRRKVFHGEISNTLNKAQSSLDQGVYDLLVRIFENKELPFGWTDSIVKGLNDLELDKEPDTDFMRIIVDRLRAVGFYYSNNFQRSFGILKEIIKNKKFNDLPSWMIQDILFDTSNLFEIIKRNENKIPSENEYRNRAFEEQQAYYYPGIDRFLENVDNWVRKENNKKITTSYNEQSSYGSGIMVYADELLRAAVMAISNGSITQIKQIPNNLNIMSELFLVRFEDKDSLKDVLMNNLLMGQSYSNIKRWTNHYRYILGQFNENDSESILKSCRSCPDDIQRITSEAVAFRIVGDYLSNDSFRKIWEEYFSEIKAWINENDFSIIPMNEILGLFRYLFRIPQEDIIWFLNKMTAIGVKRFYEDLADIVYGAIDHKGLDNSQREQVCNVLYKIIENYKGKMLTNKITNALIVVFTKWPSESEKLLKYIVKNNEKYFNNNIKLYISYQNDYQLFLNDQFEEMRRQNEQQNGQRVSLFGIDPFMNIYSRFDKNRFMDDEILNKLFKEMVDTLNNSFQTFEIKRSVTKVALMLLTDDDIKYKLKEYLVKNIKLDAMVAESTSFFESAVPTNLIDLIRGIMGISLSLKENKDLIYILSNSNSPAYVECLTDILVDFIKLSIKDESKIEMIPQVLQFLITYNNRNSDNQILINISKCFLSISDDKSYGEFAIGQLKLLVTDTNDTVKRQVVEEIFEIKNETNPDLEIIKKILMQSSSFSVRDLANRKFLDTGN